MFILSLFLFHSLLGIYKLESFQHLPLYFHWSLNFFFILFLEVFAVCQTFYLALYSALFICFYFVKNFLFVFMKGYIIFLEDHNMFCILFRVY